MMKIVCLAVCGAMILAAGVAWSSPIQNAQQFQQKAARAAAYGAQKKNKQAPSQMIKASDRGIVSAPSDRTKAGVVKIAPVDETKKPATAETETE